MSDIKADRAEGVYCRFETYPADMDLSDVRNNILVIERIAGDSSITRFECARSEAWGIKEFLNRELGI